jgi:hypothetical protein
LKNISLYPFVLFNKMSKPDLINILLTFFLYSSSVRDKITQSYRCFINNHKENCFLANISFSFDIKND